MSQHYVNAAKARATNADGFDSDRPGPDGPSRITMERGQATADAIRAERKVVASNYDPLPVVLVEGEGAWVRDVDGREYLDALSGYSAVNFGHSNPRINRAAREQIDRLGLIARAFHAENLGPYCAALTELTGMDLALPMNTGAEAVETALKAARKWGYEVKGVPDGKAEVIVMSGNFHGRTTTIVSFSDDPDARGGFGPYTPGFVTVPFGDAAAVEEALTPNTVAVLVEPVQGEAGVVIPPADFLPRVRQLCDEHRVLLIADEIQSGFGRTGATFACELVRVHPDLYCLGKALGGGIYPVSAVVGSSEVLGVFTAGSHGSTFGGNPVAAAIGLEVIALTKTGKYQHNARERGEQLRKRLEDLQSRFPELLLEFRQVGLWVGVDFDSTRTTGRQVCELMLERGVLVKDAHGSTIRISPPLCVTAEDVDFLADALDATLTVLSGR